IGEDEIVEMMQKMVRQRHESYEIYDKNGRPELAQKEAQEIAVIERFLPKQLSQAEMQEAVDQAIAEIGATSIKDMGKVMRSEEQTSELQSLMRNTYAGF